MKIDDIVFDNFSKIFEPKLIQEFSKYGILKTVESQAMILEIRRDIQFIPFIVSGIVKVKRRDGNGNGIFIHYITEKETSAIAITYAQENKRSEIRLKSEGKVMYIAIPVKVVNSWFSKYESWRKYYFKLSHKQTSILIEKINDIAFNSLEYRLLKYLEDTSLVKNNNIIYRKHFDIARDLKVSREAVSRILKKMEKDEVLILGRNKIILN